MSFELAACAITDRRRHPRFPQRTLADVQVRLTDHLDRDYDLNLVLKVWADRRGTEDEATIDQALLAKAAHILNRTLPHAEVIAHANGDVTRAR